MHVLVFPALSFTFHVFDVVFVVDVYVIVSYVFCVQLLLTPPLIGSSQLNFIVLDWAHSVDSPSVGQPGLVLSICTD